MLRLNFEEKQKKTEEKTTKKSAISQKHQIKLIMSKIRIKLGNQSTINHECEDTCKSFQQTPNKQYIKTRKYKTKEMQAQKEREVEEQMHQYSLEYSNIIA